MVGNAARDSWSNRWPQQRRICNLQVQLVLSGSESLSLRHAIGVDPPGTLFPAAPQLMVFVVSEVRRETVEAFSGHAEVPAMEVERPRHSTLSGQFTRNNAKETTWPEAKPVASTREAAGRWQDDSAASPAPPRPRQSRSRPPQRE